MLDMESGHAAEHLRKFLEPVLEEHKVDIVLSGHVHAYARTCNVYEHKCVSESFGGTTHVTLGTPCLLFQASYKHPNRLEDMQGCH